ncbi:MAG: hypothetical protein ACRDTX_03855 [Pseudonocardiaceae bacterium]
MTVDHFLSSPMPLTPIAFSDFQPEFQLFHVVQKSRRIYQQPAVDGLAVSAAVAISRGAAELLGLVVGSPYGKSRNDWIPVLKALCMDRQVDADAGADVVSEMTSPVGSSSNERPNVIWVTHHRIPVDFLNSQRLMENEFFVLHPEGCLSAMLAVKIERDGISVVGDPPDRILNVRYTGFRKGEDKYGPRIILVM